MRLLALDPVSPSLSLVGVSVRWFQVDEVRAGCGCPPTIGLQLKLRKQLEEAFGKGFEHQPDTVNARDENPHRTRRPPTPRSARRDTRIGGFRLKDRGPVVDTRGSRLQITHR